MTPAPGPYVPDRFVPEKKKRLGSAPECDVRGCSQPARDGGHCREHWIEEFFDGSAGDCPDCGGPLVNMGGPEERHALCLDCREQYDPRFTDDEKRRRNRENRLRQAHNDGSFLPKSVSEWRERQGDFR